MIKKFYLGNERGLVWFREAQCHREEKLFDYVDVLH
jgi:hypothetical protein